MNDDYYLDMEHEKADLAPKYGLQPDGSYRCQLGWRFTAEEVARERFVKKITKKFMENFGKGVAPRNNRIIN